jgi:transcription antitermination factor NusG
MLYLPIAIGSLESTKVLPSLEEVLMFQRPAQSLDQEMLSDQDEWDVMSNETVAKIQNDYNAQKVVYEVGDRVQMISGQY